MTEVVAVEYGQMRIYYWGTPHPESPQVLGGPLFWCVCIAGIARGPAGMWVTCKHRVTHRHGDQRERRGSAGGGSLRVEGLRHRGREGEGRRDVGEHYKGDLIVVAQCVGGESEIAANGRLAIDEVPSTHSSRGGEFKIVTVDPSLHVSCILSR